jgi:hypothetical protein
MNIEVASVFEAVTERLNRAGRIPHYSATTADAISRN